jgi:AcrR family transcriptional regulator
MKARLNRAETGGRRVRSRASREAIVEAAGRVLVADPRATLDAIATDAGVSRATIYRYFPSRADLLTELDVEPHPDASERILAAAADLVGRDGLRNLSMDELAANAGVSRASVYRLFPGKPALFTAMVRAYSPFEAVERTLAAMRDWPPEEVLPEVARAAACAVEPRIGIARSLLFEVTSGDPEAVEGAAPVIRQMLEAIGGYLAAQIARGRLRPVHPLLAAQAFIGPVFFHVLTRPLAQRIARFEMPLEDAVTALATVAVRGLAIDPEASQAAQARAEEPR